MCWTSGERPRDSGRRRSRAARPKAALALGMVLHELATNAVKHGALVGARGAASQSPGSLEEGNETERRAWRWSWEETGGPPVTRPETKGFGTELIEREIRHELHGRGRVRLSPRRGCRRRSSIPAAQRTLIDGRAGAGRPCAAAARDARACGRGRARGGDGPRDRDPASGRLRGGRAGVAGSRRPRLMAEAGIDARRPRRQSRRRKPSSRSADDLAARGRAVRVPDRLRRGILPDGSAAAGHAQALLGRCRPACGLPSGLELALARSDGAREAGAEVRGRPATTATWSSSAGRRAGSRRAPARRAPAGRPAGGGPRRHPSRPGRARPAAEILDGAGPLPAATAEEGQPLERGRIYVAPPDRHLLVGRDHVHVRRGPRENRARPAIDPLFRSAAVSCSTRVIGVVLSGMLNDGTLRAARDQALRRARRGPGPARRGLSRHAAQRDAACRDRPCAAACRHRPAAGAARGHAAPAAAGRAAGGDPHRGDDRSPGADRHARPAPLRPALAADLPRLPRSMLEIREGGLIRYRCHTGHAFTLDALRLAQGEAWERTLYAAMRAQQEQAMLLPPPRRGGARARHICGRWRTSSGGRATTRRVPS